MNEAHFHLVVNHLPIIVPIVALLVVAIGFFIQSEVVKRTAYFLFIIGAICTIPAFTSGEGAEEIVEELPGVSHRLIHEHEEKAELFAMLNYLLGAISLIGIWFSWKQKQMAKWIGWLILSFSLVVIYIGRQVGTSGGEIRHTEIRADYKGGEEEHD